MSPETSDETTQRILAHSILMYHGPIPHRPTKKEPTMSKRLVLSDRDRYVLVTVIKAAIAKYSFAEQGNPLVELAVAELRELMYRIHEDPEMLEEANAKVAQPKQEGGN